MRAQGRFAKQDRFPAMVRISESTSEIRTKFNGGRGRGGVKGRDERQSTAPLTSPRPPREAARCLQLTGVNAVIHGATNDSIHLAGDVEQDADAGQGDEDRRSARRDERERDALGGDEAQDHADVEEGLKQNGSGDAEGENAGEGILGAKGHAEAANGEHDEQGHDDDGADEAEFLADVGEDEVGLRFGEVKELLHALHIAAAGEAAGADGDQRLVDVEAGAQGICAGMEKGEHAGAAPGDQQKQGSEGRERCGDAGEEPFPIHAGQHQDHGGNAGEDERGAEVGLLDDEQDEDERDDNGPEQGVLPVAHLFQAGVQEPGEKQDEDGLGQLGWLEAEESAEADPAVSGVGVAEEEDHHQQDGRDGDGGIDEAGRVVVLVVDAH